jgi:hypothetical protein
MSIQNFRDAHKPLSASKTSEQGFRDHTWSVSHTWSLQVLIIPGAKQVALGTIAHSQPKEDNGRITTVPYRDGFLQVERLSGVTLHNLLILLIK